MGNRYREDILDFLLVRNKQKTKKMKKKKKMERKKKKMERSLKQ